MKWQKYNGYEHHMIYIWSGRRKNALARTRDPEPEIKPEIPGSIPSQAHFSFSFYYLPTAKQLQSTIYMHQVALWIVFMLWMAPCSMVISICIDTYELLSIDHINNLLDASLFKKKIHIWQTYYNLTYFTVGTIITNVTNALVATD